MMTGKKHMNMNVESDVPALWQETICRENVAWPFSR